MRERFSSPPPVDLGTRPEVESRGRSPRSFLEMSKSYSQAPNRRLAVIAEELHGTFDLGGRSEKDLFSAVQRTLEAEGITISEQECRVGKQLLLRVYQWLNTPEGAAKDRVYQNVNANEKRVIDCFKADGITSWEQVGSLTALPAAELTVAKTGDIKEDDGTPELEDANEHLWSKIGELEQMNTDLRAKLEELEGENGILRVRIKELEDENKNLKEQLNDNGDDVITGDDIRTAVESVRGDQREQLLAQLPKEFNWEQEQGTITYRENFIRDLLLLESKEKGRVIRALEQFQTSIMGRHASFQTKKLERQVLNSPAGSYASRATHKLRFTWTKSKGAITILEIYGRGDSRIGYSEA